MKYYNNDAKNLFLTSFLILFLETIYIRFLPANILYLGYFTNFILLSTFLGIGIGVLLKDKKIDLFNYFPFLFLFIAGFLFVGPAIDVKAKNLIFFGGDFYFFHLPIYIIVPIITVLVIAIFATLAQKLGILLTKFLPLKAYILDILGSIFGVIAFFGLSWLQTPPIIWFSLAILIFFIIYFSKNKNIFIPLIFSALGLIIIFIISWQSFWSPYYKIDFKKMTYKNSPDFGYSIFVNNIIHQSLEKPQYKNQKYFYSAPYDLFNNPNYQNILIIGAGGGSDVAIALEKNLNLKSIDAVEIDPLIAKIGKEFHPSQPYQDSRVNLYIDDGRSFLEKTNKKYDLIIYALTDSLTLVSSYSNVRLESYLFTIESFKKAKEKLTENGLLVFYNYYRESWLIEKIGKMMEEVFKEEPYIYSDQNNWAILIVGPKLKDLKSEILPNQYIVSNLKLATDNWPFLYLKKPTIPPIYWLPLALILFLAILIVKYLKIKIFDKFDKLYFFFLGSAFLLLETKSIVQFYLLFGTTWIVNSLVILAILSMVLLANLLVLKFKIEKVNLIYLLLFISLLLGFFFPLDRLLTLGYLNKYFLASLITFIPIFLANIIFSISFRKTKAANVSFGVNLLGAMVGGVTEYSSLIFGYHNLLILVIIFYFLSFLALKFKNNEGIS